MIRFVIILLSSILLITVVRSIIGVVMRGFSDMLGSGTTRQPQRASEAEVPASGELKRDPVCGTYVPTSSSVKKSVAGQVLHFCSIDCRDKHKA